MKMLRLLWAVVFALFLLGHTGQTNAAIALGTHAVAADSASATTTTGSITTQVSGSTFVIVISYPSGDTVSSLTDSKSNAYTQVDQLNDAGNGFRLETYICVNCTGGSGHTATLTLNATDRKVIFLAEVTGAATASALDQHCIVKDTSSPFDCALTTTTQANELVFAALRSSDAQNVTFTLNNSFSQVDADVVPTGSVLGYRIVSATGSYSPAATSSAGTQALVAILSIKEAAAGGTVVNPITGKGGAAAAPITSTKLLTFDELMASLKETPEPLALY